MTQTMGRTTKRVTQATHKALKSGASMTKPLRMLVTISVAFSMSKADLVFPVIHEASSFADDASARKMSSSAASLITSCSIKSSFFTLTSDAAKTSICIGNAAAPMLTASSKIAFATPAMKENSSGGLAIAPEEVVAVADNAFAPGTKNSLKGALVPIITPKTIAKNGGLANSFTIRLPVSWICRANFFTGFFSRKMASLVAGPAMIKKPTVHNKGVQPTRYKAM